MAENEITSADMTNDSLPNNKRDEEDQKEVNESKDSPTTAEFFVTTDADTEDKNIKENNTAMKSVGETENLSERPISDVFKEEDNVILPIENQTLARLSDGFLQKIQPELDCFNNSFQELTRNQRVLMETVQQENSKFSENKDIKDLADMVADAKVYYQKLVNVKKDMTQLHEKATKIKKRALKLQGQKMKENLLKEQQRDHELEQERKLIAQPARRSNIL